MTREEAFAALGNKESKKVDNNTYLHKEGDTVTLKLHGHTIITWHADYMQFTSAGWRTVTTKDRLNKFGAMSIFQNKGLWYYRIGDTTEPFEDGMIVYNNLGSTPHYEP